MALSLFWMAKDDKYFYEKSPQCLREEDLEFLLHHITPALFVYLLFLKKAIKFEESLLKVR